MKAANIEIIFCNEINETEYYEEFNIDDQSFIIKKGKIETKIQFNDFDEEIGKKVCKCQLIKKTNESKQIYSGLIEIYLDTINRAFCFIQKTKGKTLELSFYSPNDKIDNFINNQFNISSDNIPDFPISPNSMGTEERANIILINIPIAYYITIIDKKAKKEDIKIENLFKSVEDGENDNSYKFCFFVDKLKKFVYRKIECLEELNFKKNYDDYNIYVDTIYKGLLEILKKNINNKDEYRKLFDKNIPIEDLLNKKKYIFPKKILQKEINKDSHIDFIFKVILIVLIKEKYEEVKDLLKGKISPNYFITIHQKLLENKVKICKEKNLEIYEKFLLLIYIYQTKKLFDKNYLIQYFNVKDFEVVEKGSPLNLAIQFCSEFIETLDCNSNFFYALLCIDGGIYKYKYKKEEGISYTINTFGFDMYSLKTIKHHLEDMIPNIIIITNEKENEGHEEANTNISVGFTKLFINNIRKYGNIQYEKKYKEKRINKKYGFIISKIIIHELFSHKKGSFSKIGLNFDSPWSFKDKEGEIRFVSQFFSLEQYKKIDLIKIEDKIRENIDGESGYFLEFFFGKIFNKYTVELMDQLIKEKVDLSVLFDTNLWHKKIDVLIEYVKLKYFLVKKYKNNKSDFEKLNEDLEINEQIKEMQNIIREKENSKDIEECIKLFFLSDDAYGHPNSNIIMNNGPKINIPKYKINKYYTSQSYANNTQGLNISRLLREALSPNTSLSRYQELYPLIKSRLFKK